MMSSSKLGLSNLYATVSAWSGNEHLHWLCLSSTKPASGDALWGDGRMEQMLLVARRHPDVETGENYSNRTVFQATKFCKQYTLSMSVVEGYCSLMLVSMRLPSPSRKHIIST